MMKHWHCTSTGVLTWLRHTQDDTKAGTTEIVAAVLYWINKLLRYAKEIHSCFQ